MVTTPTEPVRAFAPKSPPPRRSPLWTETTVHCIGRDYTLREIALKAISHLEIVLIRLEKKVIRDEFIKQYQPYKKLLEKKDVKGGEK